MLSSTIYGIPPALVTIAGRPHNIALTNASGSPSLRDGITKAWWSFHIPAISCTWSANLMFCTLSSWAISTNLDFIQIKQRSRAYLSMCWEMSAVFLSSPTHFPMRLVVSGNRYGSRGVSNRIGKCRNFLFIPNGTSNFQFPTRWQLLSHHCN